MNGGGSNFIIMILIWGSLIYFLVGGFGRVVSQAHINASGGDFLASIISSFSGKGNGAAKTAEWTIGFSEDAKNFETATINFKGEVDVSGVKNFPDDPRTFFAVSNRGLFVSRDNGFSWNPVSDSKKKISSGAVVRGTSFVSSVKNGFLSVSDGGNGIVYKSSDNFHLLEIIFEIEDEEIFSLSASEREVYFGISDGRLLRYSLDEDKISTLNDFGEKITNLEAGAETIIYVLTEEGKLFASEDGGRTFKKRKNGVEKFVMDRKVNRTVYVLGKKGFFRSSDAGKTFQEIKILSVEGELSVSAIAFDAARKNIYVAAGNKIYKSENDGLDWKTFYPDIGRRRISAIAAENGRIIIGTTKLPWFSNY